MKLTSTVPVPHFYYPGATTARRRPARRAVIVQRPPVTLVEENDELAHKQEVVCGAILGLSFLSTMALCLWQLATA